MRSKQQLTESLPIRAGEFTIRRWTRADLDQRVGWPAYPAPYDGFNGSWAAMSKTDLDQKFESGEASPTSLVLIADHPAQACAVYVVLREIDWDSGEAGNMGLRVRPDSCDKGVGTLVMRAIADWWFGQGMKSLRHDVCAANPRAVRCYEKVGYKITGEFWQDDPKALTAVPEELRQHVRMSGTMPQIRFWWMELRAVDQRE